jgi:hypothetical protein
VAEIGVMDSAGKGNTLRVRDIRTLPFLWIQRALLEITRPSWRGLVAYNALAYYAAGEAARCRDIGIKKLADRVGVSEDTMKRGLDELEKKKAIRIKPRFTKAKNGKHQKLPNEYILIDLETPKHIPI